MDVRETCFLLKAMAKMNRFSSVVTYQSILEIEVGYDYAVRFVQSLNYLNPWYPYDSRADYLKAKIQSRRLKMAVAHNALKRRIAGGAA